MSKSDNNLVIEPTQEELIVYKQLIENLSEQQMDELANEYFDKVSEGTIEVSFARYLIDKFIRPIKIGDTINIQDDKNDVQYLFCLLRKNVEGIDYLLFNRVDKETETLIQEEVYLFFVDGVDNIGTEIIDFVPVSNESNRILDLMLEDISDEIVKTDTLEVLSNTEQE